MTEVVARREPEARKSSAERPFAGISTVRRHRVFLLADFLVNTFGSSYLKQGPILDVAGGKGDLSWVLANAYGLDSIVCDPRVTDHSKLVKAAALAPRPSGGGHGARVHRGSEL